MLPIQKLYINYNFSNRSEKVKYLVIHDVGANSTAKNNRDYFNGGNRNASADFFIDSTNIIQTMDYNTHFSWAIGDGAGKYGKTNGNSVSIEMCLESNLKPSTATVNNTIDLVKYLMKALNISADNVVRHYDCSHKNCPGSFSANNWEEWTTFKKQLSNIVLTAKVSSYTAVKLGEVTATTLNQRDHASASSPIVSTFKKGAIVHVYGLVNGFYSVLENKVGKWISAEFVKDITPVVAPVATPVTNEVYRVVTGSFSDEANADKRIAELKALGVDSFKTVK